MASTRDADGRIRHTVSSRGPGATIRAAPKARSRPDLRPDETDRLVLPGERDSGMAWLLSLATLFVVAAFWLLMR
jgi:hypothetical protein